jgi:hypothetical protein
LPILPARGGILFGVLALLSACAREPEQRTPPVRALVDPTPGWATIGEDDSLRTSIDTTQLVTLGGVTRLWIAVKDITTSAKRESESPFLRFETRQEVECAQGRARGLAMRTPDSAGTFFESPVKDSSWKAFAEHALGPSVMTSVCGYLRTASHT